MLLRSGVTCAFRFLFLSIIYKQRIELDIFLQ